MKWTCPKCKRTFNRKDQPHSCTMISKEELFARRSSALKDLFEQVVEEIKKIGDYREEYLRPDVIYFKTKSTFLAIKVKKDHLDVEFFLEKIEDVPPVSKYLQTSKNRVAHVVAVDRKADINKQLIKWIKRSYQLINPKSVA